MPSRSRNKIIKIHEIVAALKGEKVLAEGGSTTTQAGRRTTLRKLFWMKYDLNLDHVITQEALTFLSMKMSATPAMPVLLRLLTQKNKLPAKLDQTERAERGLKLVRDKYSYKKFRDPDKRLTDGFPYLV